MKHYKVQKQVKTFFGGEKMEVIVEGDQTPELKELVDHLMPEPVWVRIFGKKESEP